MNSFALGLLTADGVTGCLTRLTVLLAACWCVHALLQAAQSRHSVHLWRAAAIGLVVFLGLYLSGGQMTVFVGEVFQTDGTGTTGSGMLAVPDYAGTLSAGEAEEASSAPNHVDRPSALKPTADGVAPGAWRVISLAALACFVWLVGAIGIGLWTLRGVLRSRAFAARTQAGPAWLADEAREVGQLLGLRWTPAVGTSPEPISPVLIGAIRPVVVLPEYLLSPAMGGDRRAALAHELAHVRHRDGAWSVLLRVIRAVLWFHPLVWGMERSHGRACEACADMTAAHVTGSSEVYAAALARVTLAAAASAPPSFVSAMASGSEMRRRIRRLGRRGAGTRPPRWHDALPAVAAVGVAVAVTGGLALESLAVPMGGIPEANYVETSHDLDMGMVWIPPGLAVTGRRQHVGELQVSVRWGCWACDTEEPVRRSHVDGYWIGETEVTVGQFREFVNDTGYVTQAEKDGYTNSRWINIDPKKIPGASWRYPGYSQADSHPVVCVTPEDMAAFVNWLSAETGYAYTLPTEVQWEYAASAGSEAMWHFGNNPNLVQDYGWYWLNAEETTHPAKSKRANAWGLYGTIGNVLETTSSSWGEGRNAPANQEPALQAYGSTRTRKDCSFINGIHWSRTAQRNVAPIRRHTGHTGFRIARIPRAGEEPHVTLGSRVSGSIAIDGRAWDPDRYHLELVPVVGRVPTYPLVAEADGGYRAEAKPGRYVVSMRGPDNKLLMDGTQPLELESGANLRDLVLDTLEQMVRPAFSERSEPHIGVVEVNIALPGGEERHLYSRIMWETEQEAVLRLLPGRYRFHYKSYKFESVNRSQYVTVSSETSARIINVPAIPRKKVYYYRTLTLPEGAYEYRYLYIGLGDKRRQFVDPENPEVVVLEDGSEASHFLVPGGAHGEDGSRAEWPRVNDETGEVTFRYLTEEWTDVWLTGSFNGWRERDAAMTSEIFTDP